MTTLSKKDPTGISSKPADLAQVTVLIDKSESMSPLAHEARQAIAHVLDEFKQKEGMTIAVRTFNEQMETLAEFGEPVPQLIHYAPRGMTALYAATAESILKSKADAELTPDLKTHHVLVIITDGDNTARGDALDEAQRQIDSIGVSATFLLLDFSDLGQAGRELGLNGIKIEHNPLAFRNAMKKVAQAIGQIADNVIRQLPPTTGLCLPPARGAK